MPNRRETTITNELVNILRNMRHGWEIETEVNAFIKGNSELDALMIERGREPVGIETKFDTTTNARNLIKQAETRLVHELEAEYHTSEKTLNNVIAILYPDRFKMMSGRDINSQLRDADDLQYKHSDNITLFSRHPTSCRVFAGFLRGHPVQTTHSVRVTNR